MVSAFQAATYALNLAKRVNAKEIVQKYKKQLTEARSSKEEVVEVAKERQREQDLLAELEAQKAEVNAYRARLALRLQSAGSDSVAPASSCDSI
jgi:uncharacterized protein YlxW (UPF0749 family)